jgi:hypothetical protein
MEALAVKGRVRARLPAAGMFGIAAKFDGSLALATGDATSIEPTVPTSKIAARVAMLFFIVVYPLLTEVTDKSPV